MIRMKEPKNKFSVILRPAVAGREDLINTAKTIFLAAEPALLPV